MEALKIEILNPKALQLIKGMQELKLIKVSDEPISTLKAYLKKMRRNTSKAVVRVSTNHLPPAFRFVKTRTEAAVG